MDLVAMWNSIEMAVGYWECIGGGSLFMSQVAKNYNQLLSFSKSLGAVATFYIGKSLKTNKKVSQIYIWVSSSATLEQTIIVHGHTVPCKSIRPSAIWGISSYHGTPR